MSELSRAERRELFRSLPSLMSSAIKCFEQAMQDDGSEDTAARAEAAAQFELIDREIERRMGLLGMTRLLDRSRH